MKKQNILSKLMIIVKTKLLLFPIIFMLLTGIVASIGEHQFLFDLISFCLPI